MRGEGGRTGQQPPPKPWSPTRSSSVLRPLNGPIESARALHMARSQKSPYPKEAPVAALGPQNPAVATLAPLFLQAAPGLRIGLPEPAVHKLKRIVKFAMKEHHRIAFPF